MLQIVASLTDDSKGTNYDHNIFINTGRRRSKPIPENSLLNTANELSAKIQITSKMSQCWLSDVTNWGIAQ
jgi:hypothetical protein